MKLTQTELKSIIAEELSKKDKDEIKKIVSKEITSFEKKFVRTVKPMVEEELKKLLKTKAIEKNIAEISKRILKKLYRDLAIQHPYIIDRINL